MNNIIYNDNEIIGTIENIEKFFKKEMKRQLDDNLSIEEIECNFNNMFDILLTIQENEQESINNGCYFKIEKHPMHNYVYSILNEVQL